MNGPYMHVWLPPVGPAVQRPSHHDGHMEVHQDEVELVDAAAGGNQVEGSAPVVCGYDICVTAAFEDAQSHLGRQGKGI